MPEQFKPGDVVELKSGGPQMTISYISGDKVDCVWFEGKQQKSGTFRVAMLRTPEDFSDAHVEL